LTNVDGIAIVLETARSAIQVQLVVEARDGLR
jgi:hypothetical protein